jgi:glyoxylase-like metal-dependent hydrolase (beta-lactamase superfamily II)
VKSGHRGVLVLSAKAAGKSKRKKGFSLPDDRVVLTGHGKESILETRIRFVS